MLKIKCRTVFNARDEENRGLIFASDEGLTQQHFKEECDVNSIVRRYMQTGVLEHESGMVPHYGDVSEVPTNLIEAYDAVIRAESAFMDLPSDIRKSLDNDPSRLSQWLLDPANRAAAVKAGLIVASQETSVSEKENSVTTSMPENKVSE